MTPEVFLQNFRHLAEAPMGLARLRSLVLQLAVRGRLVRQMASELSPALILERTRKTLSGERGWSLMPPVNPEEAGFAIPSNWCWARVNDTGRYVNGIGFKKTQWKERGIPIVRIQNLTDPYKPFNFVEGDFHPDKLVDTGDLLVSWSATLEAFEWNQGPAVVNQHIFKVVPAEELVDRTFLHHLLRLVMSRLSNSDHMRGLAMKHVKRKPFLATPVGIPPLAEQHRIVARVDQLMVLCDELEERQQKRNETRIALNNASFDRLLSAPDDKTFASHWHRIRDNFDLLHDTLETIANLRETILHLGVRGRLVPQDPSDEPVSKLLASLRKQRELRAVGRRRSRKEAFGPVTEEEKLFPIPASWRWARLGEVGEWGAGATPTRSRSEYFGGSILWLKSGELNDSYVDRSEEHITELALRDFSLRENRPGDVLIAMYGATIGKLAILRVKATTNQAVCACTCFEGFFNEYLFFVLKALRSHLTRRGAGGAQPNISRQKIVQTAVPVPPEEEQRRIVTEVGELMALCDELEAQLQQSQAEAEKLMDSVVHHLLAA